MNYTKKLYHLSVCPLPPTQILVRYFITVFFISVTHAHTPQG